MRLNVNPTRMELLRLRKRLILARKGHKLLRDKQEELMRRFLELIEGLKDLREEVERELIKIFEMAIYLKMDMPAYKLKAIALSQKEKLSIKKTENRIMNVVAPNFEVDTIPDPFIYSQVDTPLKLDGVVMAIKQLMPKLIKLAKVESTIVVLSEELEKTRRRVNALEYVLIPNLTDTIRYITMKLSELERSNLVRLMRVKELVESN